MLFIGLEGSYGIHNMLSDLVEESPVDYRAELCQSLVLSGGSTCFPGFDDRLLSETPLDLQLISSMDEEKRNTRNWLGAHILSQISSFQQ